MRRSHNAQQAIGAIRIAQDSGLTNINMDLIYGVPGMKLEDWHKNIEQTIDLDIKHISAYHLTFESGTVFDHWRKKGRLVPISDEEGLEQFGLLKDMTSEAGFIHYEISNFGKEGYFSKHNTSYWKQVPYIGIGPSAHSFFENTRKWNISNNKKYISMIMNNDPHYSEHEDLDTKDRYNEYLLTSLRTMWGIDLDEIQQRYGVNYVKYTQGVADLFLRTGELMKNGSKIRLTKKGIFLADYVVREFFILDDLEKRN
jgi:oxygen-independent coproporphyrinogen-3 oxidase